MKKFILTAIAATMCAQSAQAALITDPNDARSWQGASVSTFATLFYGSNTLANRQQVVNNQLLDDGNFDPTGYAQGSLKKFNGTDVVSSPGFGTYGASYDQPNVNNGGNQSSYNYNGLAGGGAAVGGNGVDNLWIQTDSVIGNSVWDLGFQATKAAIFNTIDHGPLPLEAIESTVYLSNDMINWTQAVTERVWLEGIYGDTSLLWDGFAYAVGTGTNSTFRYASVIWGGPGALQADGDNEINGVMGLRGNFTPNNSVPEPTVLALFGAGLVGMAVNRRKRAK